MTAAYATPVTRRWPARPTTYRGVKMRSRTEANVAQWMDEGGFVWQYEPLCFADETGQYLPDFLLLKTSGAAVYIEVKPEALLDLKEIQHRMAIIWSSEPEASLGIIVVDADGVPSLEWVADPETRQWKTLRAYMGKGD